MTLSAELFRRRYVPGHLEREVVRFVYQALDRPVPEVIAFPEVYATGTFLTTTAGQVAALMALRAGVLHTGTSRLAEFSAIAALPRGSASPLVLRRAAKPATSPIDLYAPPAPRWCCSATPDIRASLPLRLLPWAAGPHAAPTVTAPGRTYAQVLPLMPQVRELGEILLATAAASYGLPAPPASALWPALEGSNTNPFPPFPLKCQILGDLCTPPPITTFGYRTYAAEHPVTHGVLTEDLVLDLQRDPAMRVLSIGAGQALAERCLLHLGVAPSQVHVADANFAILPAAFPHRYAFDMFQPWSQFVPDPFDRILFLESFFQPHRDEFSLDGRLWIGESPETPAHLVTMIAHAWPRLKPGGCIHILAGNLPAAFREVGPLREALAAQTPPIRPVVSRIQNYQCGRRHILLQRG